MSRTKSTEQLGKVKEKLDAFFEGKKYYEAQQLFRTIYSRLAAQKKFEDAGKFADDGAHQFFNHNQGASGGDLALLVLDSYTKAEAKVSPDRIQCLLKLFHAFPKDADTHRRSFMKQAIAYSEKFGANPFGHPALHHAMAKHYAAALDFPDAARHFVRADQPTEHAALLLVWCKRGLKSERDLFVSRAVLQYLCVENLNAANALLTAFTTGLGEALDTPLIHFIKFLLKTCEREAAPLFQMLRSKYQPSLARDPSFEMYLNKIGEVYFDIKAPQSMMSMLTSMF